MFIIMIRTHEHWSLGSMLTWHILEEAKHYANMIISMQSHVHEFAIYELTDNSQVYSQLR